VNPEMIDFIKEIFLGPEFLIIPSSHPDINLAKQEKRNRNCGLAAPHAV